MRLEIITPLELALRADAVTQVRAEDSSGAFGILERHADFLTVLTASVLTWRDVTGEHYAAVRGGMLSVRNGRLVSVATPEAVRGEDLHHLEREVLTRFQGELEEERAAHSEAQRLHLAAMRQIMRLLRPEPGHAPPVG